MGYVKKFEAFVGKPLPVASLSDLTNYYSCEECDGLWKEVNKEAHVCKLCGSEEIEELSKPEWKELVKSRLDKDEIENFEQEEDKLDKTLVNFNGGRRNVD